CNEAADNCTAPDANGTACDDGVFCTGADSCLSGICAAHTGNPCPGPDGDPNCAESCNEAVDDCMGPDPNGSVCDDGDRCTESDACQGGTCTGQTLAARYLDNGNGTISDCQTRLMWEKKDRSLGLHDVDNFFPWA